MAVYTDVPDAALAEFLGAYEIGAPLACTGIAEGVENSNYRLRTTSGDYILTLYERRVEVAELPWFLGLMDHLAQHGIACPKPVRGRDGQALRQLCGRAASVTTFLAGAWPREPAEWHCAAVGAALGALHEAGRGFAPERVNALGPAGWTELLLRARSHPGAVDLAPGLLDELGAALDAVLAAWPAGGLPRGHIHADLFPDNVFFHDGRLSGLIDFYFAATDALAYDIAVCLNAWCFDAHHAPQPGRAAALIAAYERVRPLQPAERAALPLLCAGAALRFALTRLYDWLATPTGALVTRKDPMDYVARLRLFRDRGEDLLARV